MVLEAATRAFRQRDVRMSYALLENHKRPGHVMMYERWRHARRAYAIASDGRSGARFPGLLAKALKQDFLDTRLLLRAPQLPIFQ